MTIRNSISRARISNPRASHNRFRLARRLVRVFCGAAAFLMVFPHLSTLATARILPSQNAKQPPLRLLTKVEEIRNLSREESGRGYSVHVQAVVTFADLDRQILFVQDRTGGIFVDVPLESDLSLKAGELVDIRGSTEVPDFAPDLGKARISIVGHSALPTPIRLSAESLESVTMDCMWVEVEGVVRSLEVKGVAQYARQYWEQDISTPKFRTPNPTTLVRVIVAVGRSRIPVYVQHSQALNSESYLGTRVRVRGVRGSFFNQKNQVVGVNLFVPGLAQIQVVEAPPPIPAVGISSLMQYTAHGKLNQRVKVEGVVTLQDPGRALFIANAGSSARVETRQGEALNPGDYVEVVGFPTMGDFSPLLEDATVHRLRPGPEVSPLPITAEKALTAERDGDLVRIDGRLVGAGVAPEGATWALEAGSVPFLARLPATSLGNRKLPPIGEGSLLRLTGVCVVNADQNGRPESFELLLRSPGDVMVLESPAWWTARRALTLLGLLLVVVLLVLGWVHFLRRQVNQQAELIRQKTATEVAIAKRFEYVARVTDDALWEVDLVTGTFWASPTFTATYGSLPERIPVDPAAMAEGVHPDDRANVVAGLSVAVQNRQTKWEAEYRRRCVDGFYANVYARAYIERDDGGRPKRLIGALTDITARIRAEEELRASRQLLQTTLYSLRDAVFVLSFDKAEILDCNPAATEIFGYSREEMVGREAGLLHVNESARLEFRKRLTAATAEKGYLQQFEFRMRRKDGTIFPTSHSVTPLRDNQGNHTGWVSLVQDITERKRTEEALLQSERRYRDFVSHSHEAVWRLEFDEPIPAGLPEDEQVDRFMRHAYIAECNDAFAHLWGAPQARDVIGKHMKDNPAFLEQRVASIRMSAQAGWRSLTIEYQGIDQTGDPLTLLRTTVPIIENGKLVRIWGLSHDLTELKRTEEALRQSEERYRTLFENATVGIYRTTPGGRILMANPALLRMLGYERFEELSARSLEGEGFEPSYPRRSFREEIEREGVVRGLESAWRKRDGSVIHVRESSRAICGEDGRALCYDGVAEDITERKLAEEALKNAEEKFRKAFNASPEPMAIRTVPDGRYVEANDAFLRALGRRREEVHGKTVAEMGFWMMPEDLSRMTAILERDGKVRDFETDFEWTPGQVSHVLVSAERIELSGEPHLLVVARDITERRRMEQALEDSQRRYQNFISRSVDGVWRVEVEPPIAVDLPEEEFLASVLRRGRLAETNDANARLLGFGSAAAVIGKSLNELVPESDEGRLASYRSMFQAGFRPRTIAFQVTGPDGKPQYLLRTEMPIVEDGRLVRAWGMTRDITELRLAEEALKESEQRYRTLFENSPVGIYRTTPDGRVLAGNPAFARMMGYSSFEELASRDLNAEGFEPEYSRGQFKEALEKAGGITGLESQWRRRDGSVIFVRENARAIRDDAGQILCYEGTAEDITERKRAEQKAAQLAAIVESSNDAIISANLEGIITSWNKGATMLYGYEESEVIGRNVSILVPPGVQDDTPQLLQRIQLGEHTEHHEVVRQRSDGQRIYISRTISPIRDSEGRMVALSTIARDITVRRQAQEELRAAHDRLAKEVIERTRAEAEIVALNQRLITAQEEERARLARELHDDLSQQIAAVGIGLSNLRRQIPERQREGREEAERTFQRLKQLGEGIRRLSHQLHPAILEHSGLVVALESYCAEFKSLTGVSAVVQADARLDNVPANPALGIFRITQEALQNVWKHSGTKKVVIHLARSGGQLRLRVSDQGSGFDPARRHKSKGLGLVSMRERAKLLGGTLTIESAKGRGTTVTAAIPLHVPRSARVSQAKPFLTAAAGSGA
ncbi:MAG: PAS domain S-box protein [Terriglobia bacterium]|jgi:PAS domain S-box-containing protein